MYKTGDKVFFLYVCGRERNLYPFEPYRVSTKRLVSGYLEIQAEPGTVTTAAEGLPYSPLLVKILQKGKEYTVSPKWTDVLL